MEYLEAGKLISEIVNATGLPKDYIDAERNYRPLGKLLNAKLLKASKPSLPTPNVEADLRNSIVVPPTIVSSIRELSLACLLGQGVLIQTTNGDTAFVSIAEAAFIQLGESCWLLECILAALEYSLNAHSHGHGSRTTWTLTWRESLPKDPRALLFEDKQDPSRSFTRAEHRGFLSPFKLESASSLSLDPSSPQQNFNELRRLRELKAVGNRQHEDTRKFYQENLKLREILDNVPPKIESTADLAGITTPTAEPLQPIIEPYTCSAELNVHIFPQSEDARMVTISDNNLEWRQDAMLVLEWLLLVLGGNERFASAI